MLALRTELAVCSKAQNPLANAGDALCIHVVPGPLCIDDDDDVLCSLQDIWPPDAVLVAYDLILRTAWTKPNGAYLETGT